MLIKYKIPFDAQPEDKEWRIENGINIIHVDAYWPTGDMEYHVDVSGEIVTLLKLKYECNYSDYKFY